MESTLRVESLAFGGDGLARVGGRAVFVPGTAPGDLARVEIGPPRAGALRGRLLEVLEPGAARVEPPCVHVRECGGCPWQHVSRPAQLAAKEQAVRDALRRIGGIVDPPVRPIRDSPLALRYRRRMHARLVGDGWGFAERGSPRAVRVQSCLLVEEAIERAANALAPALRAAAMPGGVRSFALDGDGRGGLAAHMELGSPATAAVRARAARLLSAVPGLRGVVLGGAGPAATVGDPVLVDADHEGLRVRPDLFAQANRLGARVLARETATTVEPGASVLELFAGTGTLTLPLAARAGRLVASEGEGPSLELLRMALGEAGRPARLVAGAAARVAADLAAAGERFDHVVMDPPRAGARDLAALPARLGARRITYVSCDPATFARDAGLLAREGWTLSSASAFDLFPQTFHVELLGVFERNP